MKKKLFVISVALFTLLSCEYSLNINIPESKEIDFGEMPVVKANTFKNIQVIEEKYCEKYNYPLTRFAIEYPDNVEVTLHEDEYSYIKFKVKNENEITEELSIGYTTLTLPIKSKSAELLEGLMTNFETNIESFQTDFIGKSKFQGSMEYQFNSTADYSDFNDIGYYGKYHLIGIIPFPEENETINAVLITFIANESSDIKTYADFQEKGVISKIWNTFRYIE